jgi:DNA polymerase-3 subunit gamma/tau
VGPGGLDTDALRRSWPDVLDWLSRNKRVTWTFVAQNAQVVDYDGQRVLLGISTVGLAETFRRGAHADYVRQALIDVLGVDARVEGVPSDDAGAAGRGAPTPAVPSGSGPSRWDAGPGPTPPDPPTAAPAGRDAGGSGRRGSTPSASEGPGTVGGARTRGPASWSDAPPPPDTAPSWASPLEQAKAAVAVEDRAEVVAAEHVVDDTAISDDDESIDDLTDVGVPVVERILGGTVIAEDPR